MNEPIDIRKIPLGAKPDPRDQRDFLKACTVAPEELPSSARVKHLPAIKNQGMVSSCTGHAVAWFWEQILRSRNMLNSVALSPLYPWYFGRAAEGNNLIDSGVTMRGIMQAIHDHFRSITSPMLRRAHLEKP
jgi:hypothetical protein